MNPREKQNYVYALPPLKNLHQESFSILYSFFTLPPGLATLMPTQIDVRIFPRGEVSLPSVFFGKLVCQNVGGQFFLFCQN
jgi:hypothetical protein